MQCFAAGCLYKITTRRMCVQVMSFLFACLFVCFLLQRAFGWLSSRRKWRVNPSAEEAVTNNTFNQEKDTSMSQLLLLDLSVSKMQVLLCWSSFANPELCSVCLPLMSWHLVACWSLFMVSKEVIWLTHISISLPQYSQSLWNHFKRCGSDSVDILLKRP